MSHPIEELLRDAYQAKTAQLTEARLDQLAATREQDLNELLGIEHTAELPVINPISRPGRRQHRWIAPALAAAAIAAVAIGAVVIATGQPDTQPRPNPPASHVSSPPASTTAPAPSPSATQTQTVTAPPYLPAGQTGSRNQVPWSIVGSGWRLLQPGSPGNTGGSLYLYDPAGGRYLITGQLPAGASLGAWSPDGNRALLQSYRADMFRYQEVELRTGVVTAGISTPLGGGFISYTQPRGLAIIVQQYTGQQDQLVRYGWDGTVEHRYATTVPGLGTLDRSVLYLPGGAEFVDGIVDGPAALFGNDGRLVRSYPVPGGYSGCVPRKWWSAGSILEYCTRPGKLGPFYSLYLQSVGGGDPSLLTAGAGGVGMGHWNGWPLSNGEVLLANATGCGSGGYEVLATNGDIRPLRLPAGVVAHDQIVSMDGDLATFQHNSGCGAPVNSRMIDYNMVTGRTSTLFDGAAIVLSWPGDPS